MSGPAGDVKEMVSRIVGLERKVLDLHSERNKLGERVDQLNPGVALYVFGKKVCGLEAKNGVPYVDGEN